MQKRILLFTIGSGFFVLFLLFSYVVHKGLMTSIDFNTTVRLQDHISRRFDQYFSLFSIIGNFEVMTVVLSLILLSWRKLTGIITLVLFGFFHVIELYGKYFVNHPPPPHFMLRTDYPIAFPQFYVSTDFSYPSGHSGRAVYISVVLLFIIWNSKTPVWIKIGVTGSILLYDIIMLLSRIYLAEHWTSDVIGGALLGASLGIFGSIFLEKKPKVQLHAKE